MMGTFVLVPGGWFGAWWYREAASELRRRGHEAHPVPLTGIGERAAQLTAAVNLDTHIRDVAAVIEAEQLSDVVLIGHSYGGMVITGVAEALPGRIRRLVYSDAYVPSDGNSWWDLTSATFRELAAAGAGGDGFSVHPPAGLDPRVTAHPLASFMQKIRLTGAAKGIRRRDYIYLSGWDGSPFGDVYARLRTDPAWHVHELPVSHNVLADAPREWLGILLDGEE
jgi:pimeloyl-ACP methyl ester carboxylesterase